MPYLVTSLQVAGIVDIDPTIAIGGDLTQWIATADSLVQEWCIAYPASLNPPASYDDQRLYLIELWLSAHFYCISDPRAKSEGASGVSQSYEGQVGLFGAVTRYGQQALLLDSYRGLAFASKQAEEGKKKVNASVQYLGVRRRRGGWPGFFPGGV